MANKAFIILLVFIFHTNSFGFGIGDWKLQTPNHSTINDPGGNIYLTTKNNNELHGLRKWYFYRNSIVGVFDSSADNSNKTFYFIANERNGLIKIFSTKESWNKEINDSNLNPLIFTYWHNSHISIFYILWIWFFYATWQKLLFCAVLVFILTKSIISEKINLKKPYTIVSFIIVLIFTIVLILDNWITSI